MLKCAYDREIYQTCIFLIDHWSPKATCIKDHQTPLLVELCLFQLLERLSDPEPQSFLLLCTCAADPSPVSSPKGLSIGMFLYVPVHGFDHVRTVQPTTLFLGKLGQAG